MLILCILGLAGGALFGWVQYRFLSWIMGHQKRYPLILAKLLLWGGSMILIALWSIPILICFVVGATAAMVGSIIQVHHREKEV